MTNDNGQNMILLYSWLEYKRAYITRLDNLNDPTKVLFYLRFKPDLYGLIR